MLNNRHFISYAITIVCYLAFAGILVYFPSAVKVATETSQEKVIQISVTDFVPEILPVEEKQEEVKPEEIEIEEIPEPVVKETLVEAPKPVIVKVPVVKKVKKVKKTIKPKKKKSRKKKTTKKKTVSKKSSQKRKVNPGKVNLFYKQIRVKINRYKSYPKIAKRRRMQGSVKVKFTILASGKVSNISLSGPKVFHKSARKAVQKVFPINTKNVPISLPTTVNVILHYTIR